jgi:16S rRNA (cytidine1402-2'-O)-methyltransferase
MGFLYLVATPIGNYEDVTLRALRVLKEVDLIAAEDTRHSGKFLKHYDVETPLISYHEHSSAQRQEHLLQALQEGPVALISDSGTPGLSDPGYELIQAALQAGHKVIPIPGPAAPIAALVASGLPTDSFSYYGYLPRNPSKRRKLINRLKNVDHTLLFFEVPHRLRESLEALESAFGGARRAAVCRELTKRFEEIIRGTLGEVREHFIANPPRGELTLVIQGNPSAELWEERIVRKAIADRLAEGLSPSEAARVVAKESGWPRRRVYKWVLEEK